MSKLQLALKAIALLSLLNLVAIGVAIGATHLLGWPPFSAFIVFFRAIQAGLAFAVIGLVMVVAALVIKHAPIRNIGLVTLLAGLIPMGSVLAVMGTRPFSSPMIHDISTDTADPPSFVAARTLRGPHDNSLDYAGEAVSGLQRKAYPDIAPLTVSLAPDQAYRKALDTIRGLGWTVSREDAGAGEIEAFDRSRLFGFIDDVIVRVRPDPAGSRIDMRSVSRVGLSDVGANAARIRRFQSAFHGD